jgi:hypothetical protein
LFRGASYTWAAPQKESQPARWRPDIAAARRGGDWDQGMDGENAFGSATLHEATYWCQIYTEILAMEEQVLERVRTLMSTQSQQTQLEVELTNVPVIVAHAERFRKRLSYWNDRLNELNGQSKADGH